MSYVDKCVQCGKPMPLRTREMGIEDGMTEDRDFPYCVECVPVSEGYDSNTSYYDSAGEEALAAGRVEVSQTHQETKP